LGWLYLAVAIVTEVIGTSALAPSQGFTKPLPTIIVLVSYAAAFYLLSQTLHTIPVAVAYAVWSGAGVALISSLLGRCSVSVSMPSRFSASRSSWQACW
jgi:small multidrug resistance pump